MFPIISDRMVDQNLAGLFKIDNVFVRHLPQHCRTAVRSKERLRVFFDKLTQQQPISFQNDIHLHGGLSGSSPRTKQERFHAARRQFHPGEV